LTRFVELPERDASFFHPWIGDAYQRGIRDGLRLLILGESHYGDDRDDEVPDSQSTNIVVRGHLAEPSKFRLFRALEQLITGARLQDSSAREALWQRVIFYNFVQRLLRSRRPEHRPTHDDWNVGRAAFVRLLREHRPEAVLVVGTTTWNEGLSQAGFVDSRPLNDDPTTGLYEWQVAPGHSTLATWVPHPTGSFGFSAAKWRPRVSVLLDRAASATHQRRAPLA